MTRMRKRTITMTSDAAHCCSKVREVIEAGSIFAFISKYVCNGSLNINEQVLRRRRIKRKRDKLAILAFCRVMAANSLQRSV